MWWIFMNGIRISTECLFLYLPQVILPLIYWGLFRVSAIAAIGIPQFATGPQKWVLQQRLQATD